IELLVVVALLVVVLGATFTLLAVGTRTARRDQAFANEIADAEAGVGRMVHDIRQASSVTATTPNSIDFLVTIGGQARRVFYECDVARPAGSYQECVRLSAPAGASLPALSTGTPIVPRIANGTLTDPVFSFSPNAIGPTFVQVTLKLPAADDLGAGQGLAHNTELHAGVYLRNLDVGA
ncbi:MAG: hypothetical protein LC720_06190, partial [Actinobacteria bacterium]|nr:hypothetical protein [Actinomycetota bacterium]